MQSPGPVLRILKSLYYPSYRWILRIRCWHADRYAGVPSTACVTAYPPALLRFRVNGSLGANRFLEVGERVGQDIQAALLNLVKGIEPRQSVLDFGCGCGRTLLWLIRQFPDTRFHGTDVDAEAIEWRRRNLRSAEFRVNSPLPPLPYDDEQFDLIYALSVFTHLSDAHQRSWLPELRRILCRGGTLLLTVHGEEVWKHLSAEQQKRVRSEGFLFERSKKLRGIVPDWYQTAYHTENYELATVGLHFRVLTYARCAMGYQDVLIAQRD